MRMCVVLALSATAFAAAAQAQTFYSTIGGGSPLQLINDRRVEARFRADTTNWDSRLEFTSFPATGDNTANVSNSLATFQNQSFGFRFAYSLAANRIDWSLTAPGGAVTTISQNPTGFGNLNVLHLFTNGARGAVSVSGLSFSGLGFGVNAFPSINTQPSGPQFVETYLHFGDSVNLLSGDWSLDGTVSFGTFTHNNPSEGSKITIKLREGLVPTPGAAGVLALGALAAGRRRRR